ncbi:MAG TPA: flagellar biosynthesis anti-sigma factor FlgM [Sphingomonas sp.]|jgi:negative regulator of flagellin synthesis FlgM
MVDGIGSIGAKRIAATAPVAPASPAADTPRSETPPPATSSLGGLARTLAATPPVDKDRVAQIKRAIATGTFPLLPATIADRLMALKLDWNANDPA